jgi:hypothetical protein
VLSLERLAENDRADESPFDDEESEYENSFRTLFERP